MSIKYSKVIIVFREKYFIEFLLCYTGWLIITTVDGIVNLYTCCWNETYTTLSVNYLSTIWSERDHVLVSNLQLKSRQDDVIFVMSKERLVIVILLSQMGIILQQAYFRVTDYRVTGTMPDYGLYRYMRFLFIFDVINNTNNIYFKLFVLSNL